MKNESKIYFITGVSGTGKTAIIPYLKSHLSEKDYSIHDFDERGVPKGVDSKWRQKETKYWIEMGYKNAKRGISTIICGISRPSEAKELMQPDYPEILYCLLAASKEKIEQRLNKRFRNKIHTCFIRNPFRFVLSLIGNAHFTIATVYVFVILSGHSISRP